jgi:eukaryotic-like serine/threonine-protein kinase
MNIRSLDWSRLSSLLDAALELQPEQRMQWIDSLDVDDIGLRDALREVLQGGREESARLLDSLPEFSAMPLGVAVAPGSMVGPYLIERELGSGGTSSVWLAQRADGTLQRKVALKLPHLGLIDRGLVPRMLQERDVLTRLEHPHIARLYDAGVDVKGRPWLALEYVRGVPLNEYCQVKALGVRQRLELFRVVAGAVAYAHARLVVHRDIKPANILVGDQGDVHLLDFGIARLLQSDTHVLTDHTLVGQPPLTPQYAAPEQFTGQPITVATDVYSLGVVLFELLAQRGPYTPERDSLGAIENCALHQLPAPVSTVAPATDRRALRGDLDVIVATALRKDPKDRYPSVEALAADIARHLDGRPINAIPPSFWYVARKFILRNAFTVSFATAATVVVMASLGVAIWQRNDANAGRAAALERLADANASAEFVSSMLIEDMQPGESVTLEQLIARGERMVDDVGRSDLRTRVFATEFLANWYMANNLNQKAEALLGRTIQSLPVGFEQVGARLRCVRAANWTSLGRTADALRTLNAEVAASGVDSATAAQCLIARAWLGVTTNDAGGAIRDALEARRQAELTGSPSVYDKTSVLQVLGRASYLAGRSDHANAYYAEALDVFAKAGHENSRAAAHLRLVWMTGLLGVGNPLKALEQSDAAIRITASLAPGAQVSAYDILVRAKVLSQLARCEEAAAQYSLARERAARSADNEVRHHAQAGLAENSLLLGDTKAAQVVLDELAAQLARDSSNPGRSIVPRYKQVRARLLALQGDLHGANALLDDAIGIYEERHQVVALPRALMQRAAVALEDRRVDDAQRDIQRALQYAKAAQGQERYSFQTGEALLIQAQILAARQQNQEASKAFALAAEHLASTLGRTHPETVLATRESERLS